MKRIISIILALTVAVAMFCFASCGAKDGSDENSTTPAGAAEEKDNSNSDKQSDETVDGSISSESNPVATITMEDGGIITVELYYDIAPNTVKNFVSLASSGFYDGLIFHRVIPGFMIQGGDPAGNGTGGPGYCIPGEFSDNDFDNKLSHERGVISMARQGSQFDPEAYYDTAGSQFFICVADSPFLDGQYASFGKVLTGMDVCDRIVSAERDSNDKPFSDQVIKSITVETNGADFGEPVTLQER